MSLIGLSEIRKLSENTNFTPTTDKLNNNLLIPKNRKQFAKYNNTNNDNYNFEIYISGIINTKGLTFGESYVKEDKNYTLPYFIKYTKENIPIPLQNGEYVELASCGFNTLIVATNFSKCYSFKCFENELTCQLLPFKINNNLKDELNCKITHLECGENFVIVKDNLNRFWYSGKTNFGRTMVFGEQLNTFHYFLQLNLGELQKDLNTKKITKVVTGARHAAICVNDKQIYCVGHNYLNQLGYGKNYKENVKEESEDRISHFSFVKVEWNSDDKFNVRQLVCTGNQTLVLTECGKLFITSKTLNNAVCSFQIFNIPEKIIKLGTNWDIILYVTENGTSYSSDLTEEEGNSEIINLTALSQQNLKISTGKNSNNIFAFYNEKELGLLQLWSNLEVATLKTDLPIINLGISSSCVVVFCSERLLVDFKTKLFKTNGPNDIDILFQN